MKEKLIDEIKTAMRTVITADQMSILCTGGMATWKIFLRAESHIAKYCHRRKASG